MFPPPPSSTLFPYTTLFRSEPPLGRPARELVPARELQLPQDGRHVRLDRVGRPAEAAALRSEEHTSELQSRFDLVCRLLLEKKKKKVRADDEDTTEANDAHQ